MARSEFSERYDRARAYIARKYTTHADGRQRSMGLAYVTAEIDDLAREFVNFAASEVHLAHADERRDT